MKPCDFSGRNIMIAEDQEEYMTLPAARVPGPEGRIICCWKLTFIERLKILFGGRIWHHVLTFGNSLQPQLLEASRPPFEEYE